MKSLNDPYYNNCGFQIFFKPEKIYGTKIMETKLAHRALNQVGQAVYDNGCGIAFLLISRTIKDQLSRIDISSL